MANLHPKTSGAALGAALGVIIVGVLHSISGVHMAPDLSAAIPSFLAILVSWLIPDSPTVAAGPPSPPATVRPAPPPSVAGGGALDPATPSEP